MLQHPVAHDKSFLDTVGMAWQPIYLEPSLTVSCMQWVNVSTYEVKSIRLSSSAVLLWD